MRLIIGVGLVLVVVLLPIIDGSAQLEFSCTSSQGIAIQARLDALPSEEKARFEGMANELQHDVAQLQETGRKLEEDYLTVYYKERNVLLEENPDLQAQILKDVQAKQQPLIDRYWAAKANEHPDLAQRAREGDQEATQQLKDLVWSSLLKDPVFNAEFQNQASRNESLSRLLQPRLAANPAYDSSGARMVNFQQQLNDKESEQDKFKTSLPSADSDQLTTEAAVSFAKQRGLSVDQANHNQVFRDLLVTVDYANQIRATAGDSSGKTFAMQKFDKTVRDEATAVGLGNVMEGAEQVRGAMREIRGESLNVRLGFGTEHFGKYLPAAALRSDAMKNGKSELARSIVATAAVLLNKEANLQESIKLLEKIQVPAQASIDNIVVPAPSTQPGAPAQDNWANKLATDMKETSALVYQYIVTKKRN